MQATNINNSFRDILGPSGAYSLSRIQLEWHDTMTAVFKATLNGPEGKPTWARAWLSTDAGTLAEAASPQMKAGDEVILMVKLLTPELPQFAYMRIESSPLNTEHVVSLKLT